MTQKSEFLRGGHNIYIALEEEEEEESEAKVRTIFLTTYTL